MKAWCVSDNNAEYGTEIVYAETRGKAISLCVYDNTFEDRGFTDLNARRFPSYDKYYKGNTKEDFWNDEEHRVRLVRDYGWSCVDRITSYCQDCPAKEWCL